MNEQLRKRIVMNPAVMAGKPVIRGTRIPVDLIVRMFAQGNTREIILKEYPTLRSEDIQAALTYAAQVISDEDIFPLDIPA